MFPKQSSTRTIAVTPIHIGIAVLVVLASFALGLVFGQNRAHRPLTLDDGRVIGQGELRAIADDVDFQQFWELWELLQRTYLRGPVPDKELFYGALEGLVAGLDDPYTVFFDPAAADEFQSDLEGTFEGIGAQIGIRDDQLVVIAPLKDSPAERAGVRAGDAIFLIDEVDTSGLTVDEAVGRIRGPRGTTVTLTVLHEGSDVPEEVQVMRDVIEVASVEWEVREDGIAIITIHFFNEDTARVFNKAIVDITGRNVRGIVLDLRNNPGGFLDRAVSVAGEWIGNDVVVLERDEAGNLTSLNAQSVPRLRNVATVVLVNGGSASASEIVAGALQDYGYATVIGTTTFGKGSVQEYQEFADGSGVKITVAEWLTPLERSIDEVGITPDIVVEYTVEQFEQGIDPQLNAAIERLNQSYADAT